jgi:hypothetical protein
VSGSGVLVKFALPEHLSPLFRSLPHALPVFPSLLHLPFLAEVRGITPEKILKFHMLVQTLTVNFRAKPEHQVLMSLWFELVDLS